MELEVNMVILYYDIKRIAKVRTEREKGSNDGLLKEMESRCEAVSKMATIKLKKSPLKISFTSIIIF